ncbi:MAG: response regulator [Clostridium sp.]|nr:response regulator [Clostridium sp.]
MLKILVAEDDEANRKFLSKLLAKFGEVTVVADGFQAVKSYMQALDEKEPFRLVCLDVMMPKIDGYKALDAIRDLESRNALIDGEKAKIIMISALDEGGFDEELAGNQYDCYMSKPIDILEFEMNLKRMGMI